MLWPCSNVSRFYSRTLTASTVGRDGELAEQDRILRRSRLLHAVVETLVRICDVVRILRKRSVAEEVLTPNSQTIAVSFWNLRQLDSLLAFKEVGVAEVEVLAQVDLHPDRDGVSTEAGSLALLLRVAAECPVLALLETLREKENEVCVELELTRYLVPQLVNAVEKLEKDWTSVR